MTNCLIPSARDSSFAHGLNADFKIRVHYEGDIYAESTYVSMNTMCSDISNAQNWPKDEVTCDIELGVVDENVTLVPSEDSFFKVEKLPTVGSDCINNGSNIYVDSEQQLRSK